MRFYALDTGLSINATVRLMPKYKKKETTRKKLVKSISKKSKIILISILAFVLVLLISLWCFYPKYTIWDASNPHDDESLINQVLLQFTPSISPQTLNQLIKDNANIIVIDVRNKGEYDQGYLPAAVSVQEQDLSEEIKWVVQNKNTMVYLYCHSGNRGAVATRLLRVMGYANAYNLEGGLNGWEKAGFPIQK